MGSGPYSEVDRFLNEAKSVLSRALRIHHLRIRLPAFGIAIALGIVLLFSVLIPTSSIVNLPKMTVETNEGQVTLRNIVLSVETQRPAWGIRLIVLSSLLIPIAPILIDSLFQARNDTVAQLPLAIKNRLGEYINELEQSNHIPENIARMARGKVSRLPNQVDRERTKAILDYLSQNKMK